MRAMTDFDTPSAVAWPKWYYSGASLLRSQADSEGTVQDLALNNNNNILPLTKGKNQHSLLPGIKTRRKPSRILNGVGPHRAEAPKTMPQEPSSSSSGDVKSERLSPDPVLADTAPTTSYASSSPSVSPKSPVSTRTRTPSYPGTPPNSAFTPPGPLPPGYDRFSPAAMAGPPGGAIKQMESLMNRNCSDIMRSLAAKYNHSNPNDFFSNPNNGFLRSPFGPFKSGPAPFLSSLSRDDKKDGIPTTTAGLGVTAGPPLFPPAATLPGFPGFPLVDMSSTQVLLNMVRNATSATQLETYLRGALKRPAENHSSPLDLSSSVAAKRPRTDKSFDVKSLFGFPPPILEEEKKPLGIADQKTPSPLSSPSKIRASPIKSPCSDKSCPSLEAVAHWTVEDVCSFVSGIPLCAEYSEIFREQRIDGSTLPLLTEEHLTLSMNLKLGPALKLRSVLAKKLGVCSVCLHCDHCHVQPAQEKRPSSNSSSGQ